MFRFPGVKSRLDALTKTKSRSKYSGLKDLDKLITDLIHDVKYDPYFTEAEVNLLLTYRRKTRMEIRKFLNSSI